VGKPDWVCGGSAGISGFQLKEIGAIQIDLFVV